MSKFLHDNDDDRDDAMASAIYLVFSENSRAKNYITPIYAENLQLTWLDTFSRHINSSLHNKILA